MPGSMVTTFPTWSVSVDSAREARRLVDEQADAVAEAVAEAVAVAGRRDHVPGERDPPRRPSCRA